MPLIEPPPYDPALRAAKMKSMTVEVIRAHFRETWSLIQPKKSWPTTVPAKAIELTFLCAGEFEYSFLYNVFNIVFTWPMTLGCCERRREHGCGPYPLR